MVNCLMRSIFNIAKFRQSYQAGFTLVELLVAMAISGLVLTLAGSGWYALMMADRRSQVETSERWELERAATFMAEEIKMSRKIAIDLPDTLGALTSQTGLNDASGSSRVQAILVLQPAFSDDPKKAIVYYLADPPNNSVWLGPRVIYRWGPTLLQNGNYSDGNGNPISVLTSPGSIQYFNEVLIDRISDTAPQVNNPCDRSDNYAAPSLNKRLGFYACIAADRKSARLWLHKQLNSDTKSQSVDAVATTRSN
jgi:prepilin-type N-terminal cleavage/methylation domain-containing protein